MPPLSLYIHIPWCVRKCPYCDFNSHHAPDTLPQREYVGALLADLDRDLADIGGDVRARPIVSVFFGGGTPSLFAPENIARILDGAASRLTFTPDIEITMETNPGTVEHGDFAAYARAGVNRLSFGVQSFNDDALKRIGRIHDARQAETAIKRAQDAGLANINLDLMYALPGQTIDDALADVEKAIMLQTPHLSHYQLTLEPNTQFAKNPPPLPDEDSAWDMQEACQTAIAAAGLSHYEVSAYARAGHECAHNLNYWRFGDYLGIGAGAHGKMSSPSPPTASSLGERAGVRGTFHSSPTEKAPPHPTLPPALTREGEGFQVRRRWKLRSPRGYLDHAGSTRGIGGDDAVEREQLAFEFMLNALRLTRGIALADFYATTGLDFEAIRPQIDQASARGWLVVENEKLQPTELGQRFLNDLIALFLPNKKPGTRTAVVS